MNVVLDVNIWISALLWGGTPVKLLRLAQKKKIIIFASEDLLLELSTTLQKPKLLTRLQHRLFAPLVFCSNDQAIAITLLG